MRKLFPLMAVCILAFGAVLSPESAYADRAYDFSDLTNFRLELPFNVTNFEETGSGMQRVQTYYLSDSYKDVIKKLTSMYEKNQPVGKFFVNGLTKQSAEEMYMLQLALNNEHHYAKIRPNGSGCTISFEIVPVSYVLGVYDAAIYGFHMSDGGGVLPIVYNKE